MLQEQLRAEVEALTASHSSKTEHCSEAKTIQPPWHVHGAHAKHVQQE
jgi:hypothetical protein